ncbi:MAG: response regulator, partial [Spirochaetia bacterium]
MNDPEPHQGRILLVDDEALIALSEKKILETYGYEVITAHSGDKAVETAIRDTAVSLVLMDIDLGGGIDGTEAAEQILEQRSLPIVFLTSHAEKEYVDRVKSITNYGYVLKGSGEFVLNESITMALQLFEAHQETAHKEERLSFIVNEAPVGIFQSSSNGTLRRLNSEMA